MNPLLRFILGIWQLSVSRPDALGIVRDTIVRRSPLGFRTSKPRNIRQAGIGF